MLRKLCRFIYLSCGAPRSWVLNSYGTSSAQARPGQDHNLLVSMQNFHAKSFGERRIDSIAVINTPSSLSYPQPSPPRPVKTPLSTWFTHLSSNTSGKVSTSPTSSEGRWRVSKHRHPHCRIAPGGSKFFTKHCTTFFVSSPSFSVANAPEGRLASRGLTISSLAKLSFGVSLRSL
jgi:hypothetical protein